ncbi:hypothetical protein [Paraburkholderia caledonica]|uniref:DUF4298 domain-containing protein n=1 Tax=Paraburkholderia caledonica TaxID=134536 RepID=A0AB73INX5_9BURK|nr:hypothetical protein [Paraburkholderia caledonica]
MSKSLTELIRDANREIMPADRHAILDLIEQQAARIAELDKDAARYRWLRDQVTIDPEECYYAMPEVFAWDIKPGPQLNKLFRNFDAAIDAALSAQPAKE